jgi:hypothetical protein
MQRLATSKTTHAVSTSADAHIVHCDELASGSTRADRLARCSSRSITVLKQRTLVCRARLRPLTRFASSIVDDASPSSSPLQVAARYACVKMLMCGMANGCEASTISDKDSLALAPGMSFTTGVGWLVFARSSGQERNEKGRRIIGAGLPRFVTAYCLVTFFASVVAFFSEPELRPDLPCGCDWDCDCVRFVRQDSKSVWNFV